MFYLGKILPVFVLPSGLVIVLLVLSLLRRSRALGAAALAVFWLSSSFFVSDLAMWAVEGGQVRQPIASAPRADAIVVLSGMIRIVPGAPGTTEWTDADDRLDAGIALALAGKAPRLVLTDERFPWERGTVAKGQILVDRAVALGVPRERIVLTDHVATTADEAKAVAARLRTTGDAKRRSSILLVTSAYHMRRSRLLFERAGFVVTPFPVDFHSSTGMETFLDLLPTARSFQNTETALREFYGYLFYRMRQ